MTEKENILKLIENGQLKEALEQTLSMLKYLSQKDIYATTTQLLAQLNTADAQVKTGQISYEAYSVIVNRLRLAFLDVFKTYEAPPSTRRKGYLAHNVPNDMTLNQRVECCIKISDVEEALTRKVGFRLEDTDFHLRQITRVNLEGNTDAFCIEPITKLTDQTILPEEIGSWKFFVTPLKEGTHDLIIRVQGLVPSLLGNEAQIEEDCPITVSITTRPIYAVATPFKQLPIQVGEVAIEELDKPSAPAANNSTPHPVFKKKAAVAWAALLCAFIGGATGYQLFFNEVDIEFYNNCTTDMIEKPDIYINQQRVSKEAIQYDAKTKRLMVKFKPRYDLWLYGENLIHAKNMFGNDTTFKFRCSGTDLLWFDVPAMMVCQSDIPTNPSVVTNTITLNCMTPDSVFLMDPSVFIDGKAYKPNYIEPQLWQVVLPDNFKNRRVTVSMKDGAFQCDKQALLLDSPIETLRFECFLPHIDPPIVDTMATKGSVIFKTQYPLIQPLVVVYAENKEVVSKIKFSTDNKGHSEFEIPDVVLGKKYKFEVRGWKKSDSSYSCITAFILFQKDKQKVGCDIPDNYGGEPIVTGKGGIDTLTSVVIQTSSYFNDANIYVDGLLLGTIEKNKRLYQGGGNLKEGAHKIELKKGNLYCEEMVMVEKGKKKELMMNCLCDISLSKKTVFNKTKLTIGDKPISYKKSKNKLLFTLPRQTKGLVFRAEDENELCETRGIPLSNQLNLTFTDCEKITQPYAITFKVDKQLKEVLNSLEVEWKKNGKKAMLNRDVNTVNNTITVKVWDKIRNPVANHSLTLILPHKSKKLQIGQYYGKMRDSVIKCPICLSCME